MDGPGWFRKQTAGCRQNTSVKERDEGVEKETQALETGKAIVKQQIAIILVFENIFSL